MKIEASLEELFLAYRQAKGNVFYERRGLSSEAFATYEWTLRANLVALQENLRDGTALSAPADVGKSIVVPKRFSFSTDRNSRVQVRRYGASPGDPTAVGLGLRLAPSPELAIVEALWLQRYGGFCESCVHRCCQAARLKLVPQRTPPVSRKMSIGNFKPWFKAYEAWKHRPLSESLTRLRDDHSVAIIRADLRSFYDSLDPNFALNPAFFGSNPDVPDGFFPFTEWLIGRHRDWRADIAKQIPGLGDGFSSRGLPIGSAFSRVLSNLALRHLDDVIESVPEVFSYHRYVDDLHIAMTRDREDDDVDALIRRAIPGLIEPHPEADWEMDADMLLLPNSRLVIHSGKLDVQLLDGTEGVGQIASALQADRIISSEYRLLPSPAALQSVRENITTLWGDEQAAAPRPTDTATVRYGLSVSLNKHLQLAWLAGPFPSPPERTKLLRHTRGKLEDLNEYPGNLRLRLRLLQVLIANNDFDEALETIKAQRTTIEQVLSRAHQIVLCSHHVETAGAVSWTSRALRQMEREVVLTTLRLESLNRNDASYVALCEVVSEAVNPESDVFESALSIQRADLGEFRLVDNLSALSRPNHPWRNFATLEAELVAGATDDFRETLARVQTYRDASAKSSLKPLPGLTVAQLLLLTRPPAYWEICEALMAADISDARELTLIVNALRGTSYRLLDDWVSISDLDDGYREVATTFAFDTPASLEVAIGSLRTENSDWEASVRRPAPLPRLDRLEDLHHVVNGAVARRSRTDVLVLAELSVPRRVLSALLKTACEAEITIVAGLEYLHVGERDDRGRNLVANEVVVATPHSFHRMFASTYRKNIAAWEEGRNLNKLGTALQGPASDRTLIVGVGGAQLSVLICNELTDIQRRTELRGRIDALIVPAWNTDTVTYDALIRSAALDVHAYIVCANNAKYSDSRIHAPRSESWERDVARLIERRDPTLISGKLEVLRLRMEQHWQTTMDPPPESEHLEFKPIPTGYEVDISRQPGAFEAWPFPAERVPSDTT